MRSTPVRAIPALVGFGHLARTGKDTAAGILSSEFGYERIAFADNVRAVAYKTDPAVAQLVDDLGWESAKTNCPAVRVALQRLGIGIRNVLGEDIWVDAAFRGIRQGRPTVITDVRFPNEAERVLALGGCVFRIDRPGVMPVNNHISETALAGWGGWTGVIKNDGSVDNLRERLIHAIAAAGAGSRCRAIQLSEIAA